MNAVTAIQKLVGGLLIAAGGLMAVSCGLCTGYFGITSVMQLFGPGRASVTDILPFLAVGLVATLIGVGLLWGGVVMVKGK